MEEILEDVPRHHPHVNFDEAFGTGGTHDISDSTAQPEGNDKSDEKRITIIVEATQDVKILLTPILLKIIQEFLEAINAEVLHHLFFCNNAHSLSLETDII